LDRRTPSAFDLAPGAQRRGTGSTLSSSVEGRRQAGPSNEVRGLSRRWIVVWMVPPLKWGEGYDGSQYRCQSHVKQSTRKNRNTGKAIRILLLEMRETNTFFKQEGEAGSVGRVKQLSENTELSTIDRGSTQGKPGKALAKKEKRRHNGKRKALLSLQVI
jgi:hypothetical protein